MSSRAGGGRRGFTLFEIMLVLGFILALSVLGWPVVERAFEVQRLKKAADVIRAEWTEARVKAMTDGLTFVFRYTPETDEYRVSESTAADITNSPDAAAQSAAAVPAKRLPESVTFAAGEMAADARTESAAATEEEAAAENAPPVFFFPDGTTSTSRLILKNTRGQQITLDLRGLTGVAIVGEVTSTPAFDVMEGSP